MAQFLRPDSNVTQTSFTGGFAEIDEATASDADFAYGANNTAAVLEVGLSNPAATPDPAGTSTVRYRIAKVNNGSVTGTGSNLTVTAEIYQGGTLIQADTAQSPTGTWTAYSFTFTHGSITDWTNLRFRFSTSTSGGSPANRRGGAVSWAEIEAPDAAPVAYTMPADSGSFTQTGQNANLLVGRAVFAEPDTFSFTGQTANIIAGFRLTAATQEFTATSQNNNLRTTRTSTATTESFLLSGQNITLTYTPAAQNYTITADATEFTCSGQSAGVTAARNVLLAAETYTYTGQAATFTSTRNIVNETGAYTFTGLAAALSKNYLATTVSANFTYAGNTANFTLQRFNVADSGNFALSGQAVTATVNYALTADTASAVFTGIPIGFNSQKRIYAVPTAYTLAGQTSEVTTARQISADSATFAVIGVDAVLLKQTNFTLTAEQTSYIATGTGATFTATRRLQTTSAQYTFAGQNAGLTIKINYALTADPAALALTGNTAALLYTDKKLVANKATYTISPSSTTFKRSYALGAGSTSYTVTGININSFKGYTADLSGVAYDLDTTSVQVVATRKVAATPQTYVFTGRPATLILPQHYVVEISTNAYTYEGQSITLWPPGSRPRSLLSILKPPARLFRVPYRDRNGL